MQNKTFASRFVAVLFLAIAVATSAFGTEEQFRGCGERLFTEGILPHPFEATLRANGDSIQVSSRNSYFDRLPNGTPILREPFALALHTVMARHPAEQRSFDIALRRSLGRSGNSFFQKVGAEAGRYFVPDVHGAILPIPAAHFDTLVESTGPILRALRRIVQVAYSSPRLETVIAEALPGLDADDTATVLEVLTSSQYFEAKYRDPGLREYPFLPLSGFDAAVQDWDRPDPLFYEFNLGTPSGMSNNVQLIAALASIDPELFMAVAAYRRPDNTFSQLREVLQRTADAWTRSDDGIVVGVSPGVWNAAHPDVVYQSRFSGMPLVSLSDLYFDEHQMLRWNTGNGAEDPRVSGIYNRREESFLFASPEAGLGARSTYAKKMNAAAQEASGQPLPGNLLYNYTFDAQGRVTGVIRNDDGTPQLQRPWDELGRDPRRLNAPRGNLLAAVHARRLFVSNLGGRLVDDKRLFPVLSRWATAQGATNVARPPRTLSPSQLVEFYDSPDLTDWVVKKSPDLSSAEDIDVMANVPVHDRAAVIARVRANPTNTIVQQFVRGVLLPTPEIPANGQEPTRFATRFIDLRLFILMNPDGSVEAGPNGLLPRIAADGSGVSNTGAGGGYGIGLVLETEADPDRFNVAPLPETQLPPYLPPNRRPAVRNFLVTLLDLIERTAPGQALARDAVAREAEAFRLRDVLDLVGGATAPFMDDLASYAAGTLSQGRLHQRLLEYRTALLAGEDFGSVPLQYDVNQMLGDQFPSGLSSVREQREGIERYLLANGFPAMRKQTQNGSIPVVLVNGFNAEGLQRLFHSTLGFQVEHQPTARYDHGQQRIGELFVDRDSPGRRAVGEIHGTGLSWTSVPASIVRRQQRALAGNPTNTRIEVAFLLERKELDRARFYQFLRRASVFDVPYWLDGAPAPGFDARLAETEHCFTFSKGALATSQAAELRQLLVAMGDSNPERWIHEEEPRELIAAARAAVLGWTPIFEPTHDAATFRREAIDEIAVNGVAAHEIFRRYVPTGTSDADRKKWLRLVLAWRASADFAELLSSLGVSPSGSFKHDIQSPRASVVLIYDAGPNAYGQFLNASYTSAGRTGSWTADGQSVLRPE